MLYQLRLLGKSSLLRSVATVASGTALAQAITFLCMPFITRLYGPSIFGIQSVFLSFANILAAIAALTLPMAIVLPRNDEEAYGLARLSILIALLTSLVTALVLSLGGTEILDLTNSREIASYLYLLPAFMFFSALSTTQGQWLIRKQQFRATASLGAWQVLLVNGAKMGAGLLQPSALALIWVNTLGGLLQSLLCIPALRRCPPRMTSPFSAPVQLLKRYRDFPLLRAPQVLLNAASMSIPLVLFSSLFGPSSAGFYSIAMTALGVPSTLIGNAVSQVFYPKFNNAALEGQDHRGLLIRTTAGMALAGLPIFGVAAALSPYLFGVLFGEEWKRAGEYAQWLSFWLFFSFINRPSVAALPVLSLQGFFLGFELLSFVVRIGALYVGARGFASEWATLICFSLAGGALNAILIGCTLWRAGGPGRTRHTQPTHTVTDQEQQCQPKH